MATQCVPGDVVEDVACQGVAKPECRASSHCSPLACSSALERMQAHLKRRGIVPLPLAAVQRRWNPRCQCYFGGLPDEVLLSNLLVFLDRRELSSVSRVCRRWHFLANDSSLWRELSTDSVACVYAHASGVESLTLRNTLAQPVQAASLAAALPRLRLKQLSVPNCKLAAESLSLVLKTQPHLERISLESSPYVNDTVVAVIASMPKLTHVSLRGCNGVTDDGLQQLAEARQAVVSANLSSLRFLTGSFLPSAVAHWGASLETLALNGTVGVTDAVLSQLAGGAPRLQSLEVSSGSPAALVRGPTAISDTGILELAQGCRALETLNVVGSAVTDASLMALAASSARLQTLHMSANNVTNAGVIALASLPLHTLSLLQGVQLTDDALLPLVKSASLTTLDVTGCKKLTPAVLRELLQHVPTLRRLVVGGLPLVPRAGFAAEFAALAPHVTVQWW